MQPGSWTLLWSLCDEEAWPSPASWQTERDKETHRQVWGLSALGSKQKTQIHWNMAAPTRWAILEWAEMARELTPWPSALHLGSTVELTLLKREQVSQSWDPEHGRPNPPLIYYTAAWDRVRCLSLAPNSSMPEEGLRASPMVIRGGKLSLIPTSCNTLESRPYTHLVTASQ